MGVFLGPYNNTEGRSNRICANQQRSGDTGLIRVPDQNVVLRCDDLVYVINGKPSESSQLSEHNARSDSALRLIER